MHIKRGGQNAYQNAYNIWCKGLFSLGEADTGNPFALTMCQIEPLGQSALHCHDDQEIFLIQSGHGLMSIGDETEEVFGGDCVFIPGQKNHTLKNVASDEPLVFYSLSWLGPQLNAQTSLNLIIPAPPTPNGALHLGHLSGPYLAADVYARSQNMQDQRCLFFMGTDDNQCYITNKARALGINNFEVLQKYKPLIKNALEHFNITPDEFIEPANNADYTAFVQHFFNTLVVKKKIVRQTSPTVFCPSSNRFIFGADVTGLCPHCQKPTGGHGCENCGHYNDNHDLTNLQSVFTDQAVSIVNQERYYFRLSEHRDFLESFVSSCSMHPRLRQFYNNYLTKLPDVSASHFFDWGIDVPGRPGEKIYEWIEMAGAYAFYLHRAQERFDCDITKINLIESFGFDNSFFYGLLVPALINAYDENLPKPKALLGNYFYLLNQEKFSTSRNHAIWAHEFLSHQSCDLARLYLSLTRGEAGPTNFDLSDFKSFVIKPVLTTWRSHFAALNHDLLENHEEWPPVTSLKGYQERFVNDVKQRLWGITECFEASQFSLNDAARNAINFMDFANAFYNRHRYTHDPINLSLQLSATVAWCRSIAPIMPSFSQGLLKNCAGAPASFPLTKSRHLPLFDLSFFDNAKHEIRTLGI